MLAREVGCTGLWGESQGQALGHGGEVSPDLRPLATRALLKAEGSREPDTQTEAGLWEGPWGTPPRPEPCPQRMVSAGRPPSHCRSNWSGVWPSTSAAQSYG